MKKILVILICCCSVLIAAQDKRLENRSENIEFDGNNYHLAWVATNGNEVFNEYLLDGTDLYNWQTLISIRSLKTDAALQPSIKGYLKKISTNIIAKPKFYSKNEEIFSEVLLSPADRSYVEYNLFKFKKISNEFYVYQFAYKIPKDNHFLAQHLKLNKKTFFTQMDKMSAPMIMK